MDAAAALTAFAELERRAEGVYRRFAVTYAGTPELAALWHEMAEIEAAHFAALGLAGDAMKNEPTPTAAAPNLTPGAMAATEKIIATAEQRAADGSLSPGDAAQLALLLESGELPRIVDLLARLPAPARAALGQGMIAGTEDHLHCLERLAATSGRADVAEKARALQAMARGIAQRHAASPHP